MPRVYPPIEGRQANSNAISPSLVESVAGFTAGIVSTLAVHPFDVVKTRLQSKYSICSVISGNRASLTISIQSTGKQSRSWVIRSGLPATLPKMRGPGRLSTGASCPTWWVTPSVGHCTFYGESTFHRKYYAIVIAAAIATVPTWTTFYWITPLHPWKLPNNLDHSTDHPGTAT